MKTVSKDYNFSIHHSLTTLKNCSPIYLKVTIGKSGYYRLKRDKSETRVWNVSGMYNIAERQGVIKKFANKVQMLKE